MQAAGINCRVCGQKFVLATDALSCASCNHAFHPDCSDDRRCPNRGGQLAPFTRPGVEFHRDALDPVRKRIHPALAVAMGAASPVLIGVGVFALLSSWFFLPGLFIGILCVLLGLALDIPAFFRT